MSAEKITQTNEGLNVPNEPIIPFIIGDGIGPDIWKAASRVIDAAVEKDLQGNKFDNTVNLKWKVYKQLLQKSDGFTGDLFTK